MLQRILWGILALIHFLPAFALLRPSGLTQLYGVDSDNPLFMLLHHRAALFACLFIACIWAIFDPGVRRLALVMAAASMAGFLFLYWHNGSPEHLRMIANVDLAGVPVLLALAYLNFWPTR